jgi:hypothetical protein
MFERILQSSQVLRYAIDQRPFHIENEA